MALRTAFRYFCAMTQTLPTRTTLLTPARLLLLRQFLRFGLVGAAGFLVDTGVVYGLRGWIGLIPAGLAAYLAAASTTWAGNRAWTFAGTHKGHPVRQWLLFLTANGAGFILNRGTFMLLVLLVPLCEQHPVLAVLAGVAAGMGANFHLSRKVVFRPAA